MIRQQQAVQSQMWVNHFNTGQGGDCAYIPQITFEGKWREQLSQTDPYHIQYFNIKRKPER